MPRSHPTIPILLTTVALAFGGAGCSTDDAVQKDAEDAKENVEKSGADDKARTAADEAGDRIEKGVEDVDGQ